jgi:hypothetical protein
MKLKLFLLVLFSMIMSNYCFAQISYQNSVFFSKEYSKEISLFKAKSFVINQILGSTNNSVEFEIDPLAASVTGELTSLVYKCPSLNVEGLIFGFYGNYVNEIGVPYQGYAFKNFTRSEALNLFSKISKAINEHDKFLSSDVNNHNVYFMIDDLTFLISKMGGTHSIRVFWEDFDAEWTLTAFNRTTKRFEKTLDK